LRFFNPGSCLTAMIISFLLLLDILLNRICGGEFKYPEDEDNPLNNLKIE